MNRFPKFLLSVLLASNLAFNLANAKEGFSSFSNEAPLSVSIIWNSVFYVMVGTPSDFVYGTASLINIQQKGDTAELFFITNNHVVRDRCPNYGVCKSLEIGQDLSVTFGATKTKINSKYGLHFSTVEVYNRSTNPDLALLKVEINTVVITLPRILKIPLMCPAPVFGQKLTSVAFPQVVIRNSKIQETFKRWSVGFFTSHEDFASKNYYGTTVDLLPGGSGSPVVDEQGRLFGVMARSSSVEDNNFQYVGRETPGNYDYQSLVIPCAAVYKFIYGK